MSAIFEALKGALGGGAEESQPAPLQPAANLEGVPEEDRRVLLKLATDYEEQVRVPRLAIIKQSLKARRMWKGDQFLRWNSTGANFSSSVKKRNEEEPDPIAVNIFQGYGLSVAATFSTPPNGVAIPMDPDDPADTKTAAVYQKIIDNFSRVNRLEQLLAQEAYYLWCDGYYGAYVRHRKDGDRFGYREEQEMAEQEQEVASASFACPTCGAETPAEGFAGACPCGQPLGQENYRPPVTTTVPVVTGTTKVPNGEEVVDLFGALELKIPPAGREQSEFPFLTTATELHKAQLRANYPEMRKKVKEAGSAQGADGGHEAVERNARLVLSNAPAGYDGRIGTVSAPDLITFKRTWIRFWGLQQLDDEKQRERLEALFPDGAYVAYADGVVLDARNENMDDHWVVCHALPGDGQSREPIGGSLVPVQELVNELVNLEIDTARFGIPPIFYDTQLINGDQFQDTPVKPASMYAVKLGSGQSLPNAMYSPPASTVSQQSVNLRSEAMNNWAQFLTGAQPALFGGEMQAAGATASGYAMARDQAMGRVGIVWRAIKQAHAKMYELVIRSFSHRDIGIAETEATEEGFKTTQVEPGDASGKIRVHMEAHEDYPISWAQKRNMLQNFMQSAAQPVQAMVFSPENMGSFKRILGLNDMKIPGEDSQKAQDAETAELTNGVPTPGPMTPVADPATGQPVLDPMTGQPQMQPGPAQPSIPIDPIFDNHGIHFQRVQQFLESSDGRRLRATNPPAFENVRLHGMAHYMVMQQQQAQAAQAAAPQGGPQ